jgi:hypothetical protein
LNPYCGIGFFDRGRSTANAKPHAWRSLFVMSEQGEEIAGRERKLIREFACL